MADRDTRLDSFEAEHQKNVIDKHTKHAPDHAASYAQHGQNGLDVYVVDHSGASKRVAKDQPYWADTPEGKQWLKQNPQNAIDKKTGAAAAGAMIAAPLAAGAGVAGALAAKKKFGTKKTLAAGAAGGAAAGSYFYYRHRNNQLERVKKTRRIQH